MEHGGRPRLRPVSVTVTLVDGLFVGRAAISTSLNFRSVVVNGIARPVAPEDRAKSFQALTDQIIPSRWSEFRPIEDGRGGGRLCRPRLRPGPHRRVRGRVNRGGVG
ncbi:pyridoxamine 5'-phosphate oxidase family protein [Kitasatospora purpeofusca]|uniref:pyridoxamine 5'-phosphate oxidase family protein n=1 Tax=Kitasatospora purpeofusca TaxID=67352 RepID=UPI00382F9BFF